MQNGKRLAGEDCMTI